jgi:hypothetical protein
MLILVLGSCTDSTPPPNPQRPYPFGERVLIPPPWADDFASGSFRFPLTAEDAEQILLRTKIFALGEMPPKRQVQAFNVLLDQADALARFRRIAGRGESAGQLYALSALSMWGLSEAGPFARTLSGRQDEILVYDSDVVDRRPLPELVALVTARNVGAECRTLRESTHEYFRELANKPLQPARGARGPS